MTCSKYVLAAALIAALAAAGCGGSGETSAPAESPPATTTAPATEPATTAETETTETDTEPTTTTTETETETEPAQTETEPAETRPRADVDVFIQVADGERVGGKGRVEASRGDRVRIEIAVDEAQELHLHGYDLTKNATPNRPAVFRFEAELEGIFSLESHASEAVIVDVVVEP